MSFSHSRDSREFCFLNFVAYPQKASKLTFFNSALDPLKLLCSGGQPYSFLPEPVAVTFNHQHDSPREELNAAYMTGGTPFVPARNYLRSRRTGGLCIGSVCALNISTDLNTTPLRFYAPRVDASATDRIQRD